MDVNENKRRRVYAWEMRRENARVVNFTTKLKRNDGGLQFYSKK